MKKSRLAGLLIVIGVLTPFILQKAIQSLSYQLSADEVTTIYVVSGLITILGALVLVYYEIL